MSCQGKPQGLYRSHLQRLNSWNWTEKWEEDALGFIGRSGILIEQVQAEERAMVSQLFVIERGQAMLNSSFNYFAN